MKSFIPVYSIKTGDCAMRFAIRTCLAVSICTFSTAVLAQGESPLPEPDDVQKSSDVEALDKDEPAKPTITISRSACKALVSYVPDDEVVYKPGVDVHGNKVAPADLDGGSQILNALPKEIEFPVTIDFFKFSGISVPDGVSGESSIGKITYRNGRVYFNDTPLGNEAGQDELIAACRAAGFR